MLFHEVTFMFALQVHTPAGNLVLKFLFLIIITFLQYADSFSICYALKIIVHDELKLFNQSHFTSLILWQLLFFISKSLCKKFKVLSVIFHCIADDVFDELFS